MTAPLASHKRTRFRAHAPGLAPNAKWGVYDELAKCWAIMPRLSRDHASARAAAMEAARRGGGYQ